MILLYILIIALAAYMFGPLLVSSIGIFFTGLIFVAVLILTAPIIFLVARSDMKESDRLYEEIEAEKEKGETYRLLCLKEKFEESERRVADKVRAVSSVMLILLIVLVFLAIFL